MSTVIETHGLTKRFGETVALDDLTLSVDQGEVFGFLGPNGAGKTTAIRMLLGLLRPTSGSATIFGQDAQRDAVELHRRIAYVPGEFETWPWMTGLETLEFLGNLHGSVDHEYRDELIDIFELDPSRTARNYSTGNRQKIIVVAALASRADLLILDEPTAGLDPLKEVAFRECLAVAKERGQTIFLSSHILSEVEATCDRVGILRSGRLVEINALDEMRDLAARRLQVTFAGAAPDLTHIAAVERATVAGNMVDMSVRGEMAPLFAELAKHDVADVLSREASLEELFLGHYGGNGSDD